MQPPARRAAAALGAGVALLAVCAVHIAYGGAASSGSGDAPAAMGAAELRWSAVAPKGEEKARARARLAEKQVSESGKGPAGVKAAEARAKLLFDDWGGIRKEREAKQEEQKEVTAIQQQQDQYSAASTAGSKEFSTYNILSFKPPTAPAVPAASPPARAAPPALPQAPNQERGRAHAGVAHSEDGHIGDASAGDIARYARVSGAGTAAYETDVGSSEKTSYKQAEASALKRAAHLLARYQSSAGLGLPPLLPAAAPHHAAAVGAVVAAKWKVGDAVTARSATGHWRAAVVVRAGRGDTKGEVLVHFSGFDHKYDEWIKLGSARIAAASPYSLRGRRMARRCVGRWQGCGRRSGRLRGGQGRWGMGWMRRCWMGIKPRWRRLRRTRERSRRRRARSYWRRHEQPRRGSMPWRASSTRPPPPPWPRPSCAPPTGETPRYGGLWTARCRRGARRRGGRQACNWPWRTQRRGWSRRLRRGGSRARLLRVGCRPSSSPRRG
ncbi:hypothetical protein T484DRAFT_1974025 [Baffinella frigidus]|nr:hypothetical protein T484DRAFT_1974025 [Cryptophyta sp. CCMP2293]